MADNKTEEIALALRNYECMFVLNSGKYASDAAAAEKSLMDMLQRVEADVIAKSPWQDGKLAYPINGHRKGLHYLVYFRMDGSQVGELTRLCKLNDLVLRHMVIEHSDTLFDALSQALLHHGRGGPEEGESGTSREKEKETAAASS
jgi:small subunit ribosomal protein S6